MKVPHSIFPLGDQAVSLEIEGDVVDDATHALLVSMKSWIHKNAFEGLKDVVLGYRSITVLFDLFQLASQYSVSSISEFVKQKLNEAYQSASDGYEVVAGRHIRIPVCYHRDFGLDIERICSTKNISPEELVRLHSYKTYKVYLVGFLPGFPYLGFVDQQLEVSRLVSPRGKVQAGSVGIAGKQTGIYPLDSPGGWQIIGRTPIRMFDPFKNPPVLTEVGDTVSFYPISKEEFDQIENSTA